MCQDSPSGACNVDPIIGVELRLISQDSIKPTLSWRETYLLQQCIFEAILTKSDQSLRPQFIKFEKKTGFVAITAVNEMTNAWLQKYAKDIGENCNHVPFQVIRADQMPHINIVQGKFDQEFKLPSYVSPMKYIEAQNFNLPATTTWKLINEDLYGYYNILTFSVDDASAEQLKKIGGNIYYGYGTTNLTFIEEQ